MMMGFGFGGMYLFWGILLALLAGGVALILGQKTGTLASASQERRTARQILAERLAQGEIDPKEYDRILARIE